jgi:hypothetical protein
VEGDAVGGREGRGREARWREAGLVREMMWEGREPEEGGREGKARRKRTREGRRESICTCLSSVN